MARNEYDRPKFSGVVSMTKVKNAIRKIRPDVIIDLRNARINGKLQGCSGFITDPATGATVYLSTDRSHGLNRTAYYRTARDNRDYTGGRNHTCPMDEVAIHALDLLERAAMRASVAV